MPLRRPLPFIAGVVVSLFIGTVFLSTFRARLRTNIFDTEPSHASPFPSLTLEGAEEISSILIPTLAPLPGDMSASALVLPTNLWHPPSWTSWTTDLNAVVNGKGTNGFIFHAPEGKSEVSDRRDTREPSVYNYCNMPRVKKTSYPMIDNTPDLTYELEYVEVIHRHHKRTPYASNVFPVETSPWDCSDAGIFSYGHPIARQSRVTAQAVLKPYTSPLNPFSKKLPGSCQFPQQTYGGLEDSFQHGKDLYDVYHELLDFIPSSPDETTEFRVTNNVITHQVASMLVAGMFNQDFDHFPLLVQPASVDSLEPQYPCAASQAYYAKPSGLSSAGNRKTAWSEHLRSSKSLFTALDGISGVPPNDEGFHKSWDHYFDSLSSRQCHARPLPCSAGNQRKCVTQEQADSVYRLGTYEYSFMYRAGGPETLIAAAASFGIWIAELAQHIRDAVDGSSKVKYRHNVAHDGSMSRLLAILQVEEMVWPGMGAEVVFEIYRAGGRNERSGKERYVRVLWGGEVLKSSHPDLKVMSNGKTGLMDLQKLLDYFDVLVGKEGKRVPALCTK